jgi:hypothetical protein
MSTVAVGRPNEQAVPLPVIAKRLPISEAMFRDLVRAGRVPATKIGRTGGSSRATCARPNSARSSAEVPGP